MSYDLGATAAVYGAAPRVGRRLRAVWPEAPNWLMFLIRDAVAQLRTPGRSIVALCALAGAGALLTIARGMTTPHLVVAGLAGVILYAATGPLARGLQHAVQVAAGNPLYGVSALTLVALHTTFPLLASLSVLPVSAVVTAHLRGEAPGSALAAACVAGVLTLALRVSHALKGPLPLRLLAPLTTPAGDAGAALRFLWACGELLLAGMTAMAVGLIPHAPGPLLVLVAFIGGLLVMRWRKRK